MTSHFYQYGPICRTPWGTPTSVHGSSRRSGIGVDEGGSHWRPTASQIFEGLLVEAVGETGEGGFRYPAIQQHIYRCGLETHRILKSGHDEHEVAGSDSDSVLESGDGGDGDMEYTSACRHHEEGRASPRGDKEDGSTSSTEDDGDTCDVELATSRAHNYCFGQVSASRRQYTGTDPRRCLRSRRPLLFMRTSVYFAELLSLGRVLYGIHHRACPLSGGGSGYTSAASRARRQATAYCLTVFRMCCEVGSGGLDRAEPAGWVGGGRQLDEDAATLQRTQLLVDSRLAEKLATCLHGPDPEVRRDVVHCALSALRSGHARLRWVSLFASSADGLDPRAVLALGFCTAVWVSAFAAIVRGNGSRTASSAQLSRSGREVEESTRKAALQCLKYMAAAGEHATNSWRGLRVVSTLQGVSRRVSPGTDLSMTTLHSDGRGEGGTGGLRTASHFPGWKEGVTEVLQTLAEFGSGETHDMLRAQPGLGALLRSPELGLFEDPSFEGLASRAMDLLKGGTLVEIASFVRRTHSMLATAVRTKDCSVLGIGTQIPDHVVTNLSLIWGWMRRTIIQLQRDETNHPSTDARTSVVWECLGLMRLLVHSVSACRLTNCEVHPDLAPGLSRSTGKTTQSAPTESTRLNRTRTGSSIRELAAARTGLEVAVILLSAEITTPLDLHRAHPIPSLAVGAADVVADALTYGTREVIDSCEKYGLGTRMGLAMQASTSIVRESRRLGVEDVHLLWTYPAGRRARVKLLDRILWRSQRGLHQQLILSGLLEFIALEMLPDCHMTDLVGARLPASFVRHNGTPLLRNEGIALVERVVARRRRCPTVAREVAKQAVRHDVPSSEHARLCREESRSIRVGVSACLRGLARLHDAAVDNSLALTGVPRRAIRSARRHHTATRTRRLWARWLRSATDAPPRGSSPPLVSSRVAPPHHADFLGKSRSTPVAGYTDTNSINLRTSGASAVFHAHHDAVGYESRDDAAAPLPSFISAARTKTGQNGRATTTAVDASNESTSVITCAPLHMANSQDKRKAIFLTIEGDLPTISVPSLLELLAAEIGTDTRSISLMEIGGSHLASTPENDDTPNSNQSKLVISLPDALANQLYTRCLAGVLRVPGLLYFEVRIITKVPGPGRWVAV